MLAVPWCKRWCSPALAWPHFPMHWLFGWSPAHNEGKVKQQVIKYLLSSQFLPFLFSPPHRAPDIVFNACTFPFDLCRHLEFSIKFERLRSVSILVLTSSSTNRNDANTSLWPSKCCAVLATHSFRQTAVCHCVQLQGLMTMVLSSEVPLFYLC
jgi:hypothetical protein